MFFGVVGLLAVCLCGQAACLDQLLDPWNKIMSADLVGIKVELAEDDFEQGLLHASVAASVEALRVSEQFEGVFEELSAGGEGAGGVGELVLDLAALGQDKKLGKPYATSLSN